MVTSQLQQKRNECIMHKRYNCIMHDQQIFRKKEMIMKKLLFCVLGAFFITKECTAANKHCLSRLVSDSWDDKTFPVSKNINSCREFSKYIYICPPHHRFVCLEDDEENVLDNLECNPGATHGDHLIQLTFIITLTLVILNIVQVVVGMGLNDADFVMRKKHSITKNKNINQTHYHRSVTYHIINRNSESEGSNPEQRQMESEDEEEPDE